MPQAEKVALAARTLATQDEIARVRLAASPETSSEVLQILAADRLVTVRAAVAMNPSVASQLDDQLATDPDARVRMLLARKLASLLPQVCAPDRDGIREQTLATLSLLVGDEAVRVRAAIADVLKDMPQAPRDLILRLAHDTAVPVSEPVIRLSPLLTAEDLLALLQRAPQPETAMAIARRHALDEQVADAIAATASNAAVAALLDNPNASIREATLDALVTRAATHTNWHGPLVRRQGLGGRAASKLSEFVATHLLEVLASRADLDPAIIAELRQRLAQRLQPVTPATNAATAAAGSLDEAVLSARMISNGGGLNEAAILGATQRGDWRLCAAMLAVAANVPGAVVERAAMLRNAKGLLSLVWAGGFSMRLGGVAQAFLCGLSPNAMLQATANGDFPLTPDEMRWQLELLKRSGR